MTTAAFGHAFRTALASVFISSQSASRILKWKPNLSLEIGTRVENEGRVYISVSQGRTGSTAPRHRSGVVDNLLFLEDKVKQSGISSNLYLFVGKSDPWNRSDEDVEDVDLGDLSQNRVMSEIIGLKKLNQIDSAFCVRRFDWLMGEYYQKYTDKGVQPYPFYAMNREQHLYKCLDNNGGAPSTIEPTGTSSFPILYGDGYVWKYMASVDPKDAVTFLSEKFIPLRYKLIDDGSPQYLTQSMAKGKSVGSVDILSASDDTDFVNPEFVISGEGSGLQVYIVKENNQTRQLIVSNPGEGYETRPRLLVKETSSAGAGFSGTPIIDNGSITGIDISSNGSGYTGGAVAFILGDGEGAKVTCTVELGVITGINIVEPGSGYSHSELVVIPGTQGMVAEGILSPRLGHGYNVLEELGASTVVINATIPQNEYFPQSLSFRRIGLLNGGIDSEGSLLGEEYYAGPAHTSSNSLRKIDSNYGQIVYMSNFDRVERVFGQEERLKIIIEF